MKQLLISFLCAALLTACSSKIEKVEPQVQQVDLIPGPNPRASLNPSYSIPRDGVYADTEWTAPHGGPRNSDFIDIGPLPRKYVAKFAAAEGATTLYGASIGQDGTLYFANGSNHTTSNFYAYNQDGSLRWSSEPWGRDGEPDMSKLDACALWNSPLIDDDGYVYISDCNQMWSFTPAGEVRWVTEYPLSADSLAQKRDLFVEGLQINPFGGIFFTIDHDNSHQADGFIGGVTFWGDIVLMDRHTGKVIAPVVNMPGEPTNVQYIPVPESPTIPIILTGPALTARGVNKALFNFFQGVVESSNAPAVHPTNDRIYVTGWDTTLSEPDNPGSVANSALYGFKTVPRSKSENDFTHDIVLDYKFIQGPRSGSSPTISPDGLTVYVTEGGQPSSEGVKPSVARSLTTESPIKQNWQNVGELIASSFAVDHEGNALTFTSTSIIAFPAVDPTPEDDMLIKDALWEFDVNILAKLRLPESPDHWLTRAPGINITWLVPDGFKKKIGAGPEHKITIRLARAASPNCVVSIQRDTVTGCAVIGYSPTLFAYEPGSDTPVGSANTLVIGTEAVVFSLERTTGELIDIVYDYFESSEGVVVPSANGLLTTTRGGMLTAIASPFRFLLDMAGLKKAMTSKGGMEVAEGLDDISVQGLVDAPITNGYIRVLVDATPGTVAADGEIVAPGLPEDTTLKILVKRNREGTNMQGQFTLYHHGTGVEHVYEIVTAQFTGYKGITGTLKISGLSDDQRIPFTIYDWSNAQL